LLGNEKRKLKDRQDKNKECRKRHITKYNTTNPNNKTDPELVDSYCTRSGNEAHGWLILPIPDT